MSKARYEKGVEKSGYQPDDAPAFEFYVGEPEGTPKKRSRDTSSAAGTTRSISATRDAPRRRS